MSVLLWSYWHLRLRISSRHLSRLPRNLSNGLKMKEQVMPWSWQGKISSSRRRARWATTPSSISTELETVNIRCELDFCVYRCPCASKHTKLASWLYANRAGGPIMIQKIQSPLGSGWASNTPIRMATASPAQTPRHMFASAGLCVWVLNGHCNIPTTQHIQTRASHLC